MAPQRLVLLAIMVICVLDLWKSRRAAHLYPGSLRVVLVADGQTQEVEGFVRYLYWEISVRNRRAVDISVSTDDPGGECARVAKILESDGLVSSGSSSEDGLVFRI